jgi:two-component system nitrogen regulation sensor histidine kinase NtrY
VGVGLRQRFRDLTLRGKLTLTLAAVFGLVVAAFLLVLLPLQAQQRVRLLEQDERLLATLREKYHRDLIYDVVSENRESLAIDLAELARQPGIVWARLEADQQDVSATGEPRLIQGLVPEAAALDLAQAPVLVVQQDGGARLLGAGGRPLAQGLRVAVERLPRFPAAAGVPFRQATWNGDLVLRSVAPLTAADEVYGRLHIVYSLAELERAESITRLLFYGLVGSSFVLLVVLLNLLIGRIVIAPLQRVLEAMRRGSKGELSVRLPVHSRDEIGTMAEAFNRMVAELESSKRAIEEYSRNLEAMVAERTGELRESEARLRELRDHLATVIANLETGVVSLDADGRVTTFNERASEVLELPAAEVLGRPLREVLADGERPRLLELLAPVLDGGSSLRKGQLALKLPRGRRTLSLVASSLPAASGRRAGSVVVLDDLTQLLASQRLAAWKEAVERVIHEIKNPLTPIGLAAQTLKSAHAQDRARFDEMFPPATDMILQAVQDLKRLISEFTRFSRLPRLAPRRQDVNLLVAEALAPYEQGAPDGIRVRRELGAALPEVEVDADQLKRVLLNVINNGIEAMDGRGGELSVATSGDGERVRISVRDQGPGLDDVERIFEPYYTTKVKGTGLGLAIARQIVEEHGGEIKVESELGVGTSVAILLPAAPA